MVKLSSQVKVYYNPISESMFQRTVHKIKEDLEKFAKYLRMYKSE